MARLDYYMPAMALFLLQFTYAGVSLGTRAALLGGMSPRVFVVYWQAMATAVIAPITYFSRHTQLLINMFLYLSLSLSFPLMLIDLLLVQSRKSSL